MNKFRALCFDQHCGHRSNLLFFSLAETVVEPDEPNNEYCDDGQGEFFLDNECKEVFFRCSYLLIHSPKFVQVRKSRDWNMLSLSKTGRTEMCIQELEMGNLHQHYIDFKT